jgi:hypothetical protein
MHRFTAIAAASLIAAGCSSASATPNSQNPAHCVAAINYTNFWLRQGGKTELLINGTARAVFVLNQIRASGASLKEAKAEGARLTKAIGNDPERMNALAVECLEAQDRDPKFSAELPALIALVRANPELAK